MKLSIISTNIKTGIWVVFWSQRMREIAQTQTQDFINRDFMRKPNSAIFSARIFKKSEFANVLKQSTEESLRNLWGLQGSEEEQCYRQNSYLDFSPAYFPLHFDPNVYLYILVHFQWIQVYMYSCKTLWYCCKMHQSCICIAHEHIRWYLNKKIHK